MTVEIKTTRDVFIEQIYNRMHEDDNIFFLCADFGSPKLDALREKFKDRFINVGIAEQNLINVATGLALEGYTVYAYAIAPFLTMRAYEQIRVNLSLLSQIKEINVNLIGVGAGLSYDVSGPTHHCLEDISIMRTLPNMIVFSPSDWVLAQKFVDYSINIKKPKYLRFDGKPIPRIYENTNAIQFKDGFSELFHGDNICLVTTGYMTNKAIHIAKKFANNNIFIGVIDVYLLKPFNERSFFEKIKKYTQVITLEEAFINKGGLDGLISKILDSNNSGIGLKRMGFEDAYVFDIGSREYLHTLYNLDEDSITKIVKDLICRN
jgi:transketolase